MAKNPDVVIIKLQKLIEATVTALAQKDGQLLYRLAKAFSNVVPTKAALAETGASKLLNDSYLWAQAEPSAVSLVSVTL